MTASNTATLALLLAGAGQVALTGAVGVRLLVERLREMKQRRIAPQQLATSRDVVERLQAIQSADNFRNLFEVPVLFHALVATGLALGAATPLLAGGALLYVLLRVLHSVEQCGRNNVRRRFAWWATSGVLLLALWALLLVQALPRLLAAA